jgi:hypothetical protein
MMFYPLMLVLQLPFVPRVIAELEAPVHPATDPTNPEAQFGPYTVSMKTYDLPSTASDSKDSYMDKITVWYPSGTSSGTNDSSTFPFISYAHGMFGGGAVEVPGYNDLLHTLSSFGYVVGATHQCSLGCFDDCLSLKKDPPCFGHYYKKQLSVIDYAREAHAQSPGAGDNEPFKLIDFSVGVGIAGHSMGGQATLFSSSYDNATDHDIRASVLHHAFSHTFPEPTVPTLVFTGEADNTTPPETMGIPMYQAALAGGVPTGIVDKTLANHHEPDITCMDRNGISLVGQFTAAWFKVYLDKTPQAYGFDFNDMLFGDSADSVCNGGDGQMTQCTLNP